MKPDLYRYRVLALCGKARAGKDTVATLLKEFVAAYIPRITHVRRFSLAEPIKDLARTRLGWDGRKEGDGRNLLIDVGQILRGQYAPLPDNVAQSPGVYDGVTRKIIRRKSYDVFKVYNSVLLGGQNSPSGRPLLCYRPRPHIFTDIIWQKLSDYRWPGDPETENFAVITDLRYYDEYMELFLRLGSERLRVVEIRRPELDDGDEFRTHHSETDHKRIPKNGVPIVNDWDLEDPAAREDTARELTRYLLQDIWS